MILKPLPSVPDVPPKFIQIVTRWEVVLINPMEAEGVKRSFSRKKRQFPSLKSEKKPCFFWIFFELPIDNLPEFVKLKNMRKLVKSLRGGRSGFLPIDYRLFSKQEK